MLAHDLLDTWAHLGSPVHRLDARVKLVCAVVLVVAILATPVERPWLLAAWAAVLVAVWAASAVPTGWLGRRLAILLPFLLLGTIALLFVPPTGADDAWRLAAGELSRGAALVWLSVGGKCLLALMAATLLTGTTSSAELLRAAGALGVPRTLTALTGFAITYLAALGEETGRMITARRSRGRVRGVGRSLRVAASMTAALMARTVERAERIALAMVARGYRGRMPALTAERPPPAHLAGGAAFVAAVAAAFWVGVRA
ncbi:MAG: energy-coupling factor transporter transmembrane component T [Armatimonadota bacterium]